MNQLKQEYEFEDGPHMGRWGKAPRKGYVLTSKKPPKRKLFLKEVDISTKKSRKEYSNEAKANTKCTKPFPTKCIKTWRDKKQGFILSNYIDSIKWSELPKKHEEKAIQSLAKQLKHMHDCNITHGDLAPKNLLVDKQGKTSIVDFEDALPLTKETKEEEWNTFRIMFFPYTPKERKDAKVIRLFNYAQLAAPNDGCVLQLTTLAHGESDKGFACNLVVDKKKVGRVFLVNRKAGKWKYWMYVANVEVYPKYQGKGYCTKMMRLVKMFGIGKFYLHVYKTNVAAVKCYKKAGFEIDEKNSTKTVFIMVCK